MDKPSTHEHVGHMPHEHLGSDATTKAEDTLKDPVCGMVVTAQSLHHVEHDGHPYYFCSSKCQEKFSAEPQKYIADIHDAVPKAPVTAVAGTNYTRPPHPGSPQDHPGH